MRAQREMNSASEAASSQETEDDESSDDDGDVETVSKEETVTDKKSTNAQNAVRTFANARLRLDNYDWTKMGLGEAAAKFNEQFCEFLRALDKRPGRRRRGVLAGEFELADGSRVKKNSRVTLTNDRLAYYAEDFGSEAVELIKFVQLRGSTACLKLADGTPITEPLCEVLPCLESAA